jgi:hypothetical protein
MEENMYLDEKSLTAPPVEAKPDIYALSTLIAWLEKQPKEATYNFHDCNGKCLIGQYMSAHGIRHIFGDGQYSIFHHLGGDSEQTGWGPEIAGPDPQTFGAALLRAKALAA